MTFDPPQAAQTPSDPGEQAVEQIAGAVEEARSDLQSARDRALAAASSDAERAAVNARFDAMDEQFGEYTSRIEAAIQTGNTQMTAALTGFLDRLESKFAEQRQQSDDDFGDDDIVSIEEVLDDLTSPVAGAAAAAGSAIEEAVDEAPQRVHGLFRPLFGKRD